MNFAPLLQQLRGTALAGLADPLGEESLGRIRHGDFRRLRCLIQQLPRLSPSMVEFAERVAIGSRDDCDDDAARDALKQRLLDFSPWRKGPFELFGIDLDAEWRSEMKWSRLDGRISNLAGRKVLDVGCGNGYYGFRMLGRGAAQVIGLEPHIPYAMQFWALKSFVPAANCWVLPMSLEQFPRRGGYFDTVFSMGVLYHAAAPMGHLSLLRDCLRPGGELVLETLFVEGGEGYCLTPRDRYAQMRNVWFIPSIATLKLWLQRCGFTAARIIDRSITTPAEQRRTEWMSFHSLCDALNGGNPGRTIEGHPAPARVLLSAWRME